MTSASRGSVLLGMAAGDAVEGWTSLSLSNIKSSRLLNSVSRDRRPSSRALSTSMWPAIENAENDQPMPSWPYDEDQRRIHDSGGGQTGKTG